MDDKMVVLDLETGKDESLLDLENIMMISRKWSEKHYEQDTGKHIEDRNEYCRLVMTKESSPMMKTQKIHTGNTSSLFML